MSGLASRQLALPGCVAFSAQAEDGPVAVAVVYVSGDDATLHALTSSAAGEALVPVVRLFIGQENPWPADMLTVVPVVAIAAALLSPVFVPIARGCLRVRGSEWVAPTEELS